MAKPRLLILFASQTGNSKDVAERVDREARRRHFRSTVLAMDAYDVLSLPDEAQVVFIASTTGQGESPNNMRSFWRFLLRKSLLPTSLSGLKYAVFGLGDSGYINYNVVAKKLDRRLAALGACELLPRGLGDDQHPLGYEATLDPWLQNLWQRLRLLHPLARGLKDPQPQDAAALDLSRFRVELLPLTDPEVPCAADRQEEAAAAANGFSQLEASAMGMRSERMAATGSLQTPHAVTGLENPCMATLMTNRRITALDHFQDTRHIEFSLGSSGPSYEPGDVLSVVPWQSEAAVVKILRRLGLKPGLRVLIQLREMAPSVQEGHAMEISLDAFLQGALDLDSASPRRYFFEVLQHFATDELQKERLQHFASAEGREDLALYNQSEGRTVLEVLEDFSSAQLPLEWLIQTCPRLLPRQFSIASSPTAHPGEAHITLAVVDYRTPFKRRKRGLCSTWLAALTPGAKVPVWTERGAFHLPQDPKMPLVMIGPGTGVAPFRAFLEEREVQKASGITIAPSVLYFGCRSREKDFYYEQELRRLQREGVLAEEGGLVTAFSRDGADKVYVTHRLAENAGKLLELLSQGAYVFVCGSASKMPQEVAAIFNQEVLQKWGGLSAEGASRQLRQLEAAKRYVVEAWS